MPVRDRIRRLFFTSEPRLRTPFRVGLAIGITFILLLFVQQLIPRIAGYSDGVTILFAVGVIRLALFLGSVAVFVRLLDRRQLTNYGILPTTAQWWRELGIGFVIGAGLIIGLALVKYLSGWASVRGVFTSVSQSNIGSTFPVDNRLPFWSGLFGMTFLMVVAGITEEVAFRGYLIPNLEAGFSFFSTRYATLAAVITASLPFALGHLPNPNATVISTFNTFLAGMWLALAYVFTGRLGLPIGLHIGWNLTMGIGVGLPVSGLLFPAVLIHLESTGPTYITGGTYGPEGGILGVCAIVLGLVFVWWYSKSLSEE